MQRTPLQWIAAISTVLAAYAAIGSLSAARRPSYGGELRIEMRAAIQTLEPSSTPDDPVALGALRELSPLVFETYVRLDEHGQPQPWLATSWTHDVAHKSWVFQVRKGLKFHDGSAYSPAGGTFGIGDEYPIEWILADLANPRNAVFLKTQDGALLGTGPFRIARWEAGKSATLIANDQYWGGRPFLDSLTVQMGRTLADQANDFQIGKADAVEIPVRDLRAAKQRGNVVWSSLPSETIALQFGSFPASMRDALALVVDRTAIHNVLLQKQGEISGSLLPGWVSGYSFLFPTERNVASAKNMVPVPQSLSFGYDRQDPVMRSIAERIAVNASEARITLRQATGTPDVTLVRLPLVSRDPWQSLEELARLFKLAPPSEIASPYQIEKSLIDSTGVIPLFHVPPSWMLSPRVRNWPNLENVWLDARSTP
jgi:peptide/nickel transport system substrate-binding protein